MDFIINYWAILLVALILILLVILAYLIDQKMHKLTRVEENHDQENHEPEKLEIKTNDFVGSNVNNVNIESSSKELEPEIINNLEKSVDDNTLSQELDYDELDIEDIDDEFDKVIPPKKLIDDSIKKSIDSIKIEPISLTKVDNVNDSKIELPDIKLKKDHFE